MGSGEREGEERGKGEKGGRGRQTDKDTQTQARTDTDTGIYTAAVTDKQRQDRHNCRRENASVHNAIPTEKRTGG